MTLMHKFLGATAAMALSAGAALAEPALIFDLGGKFDKSFNEAAFGGATRWAEETGQRSAKSNCSPKHSVNRPCAALPKRAQTRS